MRFKHFILLIVLTPLFLACPKKPPKDGVLLFSKTEGYRHESIEPGTAAIRYMGKQNDFWVEATEDAKAFTSENLKRYNAVIFLNTTENVLDEAQQEAFRSFINGGGGFVGIHAATDTEYNWPWYGQLVGAYFDSHPDQQDALIHIKDTTHLSTKSIPIRWEHFDEWYNFKDISSNIKVLATVDENSYEGGTMGDSHPISWYQEFDGGKMFYTGLGHVKQAYTDEHFLNHILGGIEYVLGR